MDVVFGAVMKLEGGEGAAGTKAGAEVDWRVYVWVRCEISVVGWVTREEIGRPASRGFNSHHGTWVCSGKTHKRTHACRAQLQRRGRIRCDGLDVPNASKDGVLLKRRESRLLHVVLSGLSLLSTDSARNSSQVGVYRAVLVHTHLTRTPNDQLHVGRAVKLHRWTQ